MLEAIRLSREEDIERSKEIVSELEKEGLTKKERDQLRGELERLITSTLNDVGDEVRHDLNNLSPLLRGSLIKTVDKVDEEEIEVPERDLGRFGYPGYAITIDKGKRVIYDPSVDESERKYKPYPKVKTERLRKLYVVETNREQVEKIRSLLEEFWKKVREELRHVSLDKIWEEKERVRDALSHIDLRERKRESFSQSEYEDASYIQKPIKAIYQEPGLSLDERYNRLKEMWKK